ncbi:MAG: glycosyltransferase family 4 protein [Planctomycetes bacterium]|nr:glycosyltransferase family 4 protein [Planctomycetota bacterium]
MRVLLLPGYFVHYSIELANGLAAQGATVGIALWEGFADQFIGPNWQQLLDPRVELLSYTAKPDLRPWSRSYRINRRWLKQVIPAFAADVMHLQEGGDLATLQMLFRTQAGVVATIHDVVPHPGNEREMPLAMRFLIQKVFMPRARRRGVNFILHGDNLKADFARLWKADLSKVHAIRHGVLTFPNSPPRLPPDPSNHGPALLFGQMKPYKGLDVLAEAIPLVHERLPDARFIIAGQGRALKEQYGRLNAHPGVEIRQRFIPPNEAVELFRHASVNLLPYHGGSQSGVVAAGFPWGLPTIASRVGAIPDVVRHGENGLLVEPGNAQELADALVTLWTNPALQLHLSNGALQWAEGPLSWRKLGTETLNVYSKTAEVSKQGK